MNSESFFLEANDAFPVNKLVHQLFFEQAGQHPDRIALVEGDKELTYGELDRITDSIAAGLIAHGIRTDDAAGIFIDRSINYIIAILAIVKSGGCYVPIDPDIPAERLSFIIHDTGCKQILSESLYAGKLSGFMDRVIMLDKLDLSALTPLSAPPVIFPSSLAYIIYTSGSTGTPKGVEIEHAGLLNLVHWHHQTFVEEGHYRASQSAGPGFDASVREIWVHLTNGATIYIIPEMLRLQPQKLVDWLTVNKINECSLSTPVAELVLGADWKNNTSLKYLQCGGEKLNRKPGSEFPAVLANLYGPTECTVDSTWAMFKAGDDDGKPPHIGTPVSNFRIYILDEELKPAPRGTEGEICIGGIGLARGYRNLPELTGKAFVPDPFLPGKRIYRSGDLGRINAEGNIECAGRKDFQVKIRGYRIELGEIEAVLAQHENVSKCVVTAREKGNEVKYLAAYFILKKPQEQKQLTEELRDLLNKSLPEYMIPATYTVLQELPLTLNGKVDRKALPEPEIEDNGQETNQNSEPQSPLEMQIRLIFSKVLDRKNIDADADFVTLGIDSLSAIKLLMEVESLGVKIPFEELYHNASINSICNYIRDCSGQKYVWSPVVKLAGTSGNKPPLFLIHTTPGDILGYINLVHYLDDRAIYGIQSLGLYSPGKAHKSIESMASYYISEMSNICPEGPYLICGWCFGGIVAYEMAQQLKRMGKQVAFLGLIETYSHLQPSIYNSLRRIIAAVKWGPRNCINYLTLKFQRKFHRDLDYEQLDFISQRFANAWNEQTINNMKTIYQHNTTAATGYVTQYYDGKISLFMSKETLTGKIPFPCYGLKHLSRDLELYTFDSEHDDILREPQVALVAEKIVNCMTDSGNNS